MHGVSRLLFAWLLLAGIVSLLAGAARVGGKTPLYHETTEKNGARAPLFCGDGSNGLAGDLAVEPKPDQGANVDDFGALNTAPIEQERTTRFFVVEQTWRESALRDARPIRGPPARLLG